MMVSGLPTTGPKSKLETLFWLQLMALSDSVPMPSPEYRFHPVRLWRIDFAWPALKLAVELEGGIWTHGRHTRGAGVKADMEKYNALAKMGWVLLRYDGAAVRSGDAAREVEAYLRNVAPRGVLQAATD